MNRRAAGSTLLLCALLVMVLVHGMLARYIAGVPEAIPPPAPPPSGACGIVTGSTWRQVDCSEPHTSEVVIAWPAGLQPRSAYTACLSAAARYVESTPEPVSVTSPWIHPRPPATSSLVVGPDPTAPPGRSWRACIVRPLIPGPASAYRGALLQELAGPVPADLRACYNLNNIVGPVDISCTAAHVGEIAAVRMLQIEQSGVEPQPVDTDIRDRADCLAILRQWTRSIDPTYDDRLTPVVLLEAMGQGVTTSGDARRHVGRPYVLYRATCGVQTISGRLLSGSVEGLASAPLPLS